MGRAITGGSVNQSTVIRIVDSTTFLPEPGVTSATSGLDLRYRREGAVTVSLTESDLSALTDAHSDGGMLHIHEGYYRVDVPDAAFAAGVGGVLITGAVTGMVVIGEYHPIDEPADMTHVSGDATAADNFETMLDGTGGSTLSLGQLNVVNSGGDAVVMSSTGSNGRGLAISGNGSGDGMDVTAGATGIGLDINGGGTSGSAVTIDTTSGDVFVVTAGGGDGDAMRLIGHNLGHGLHAEGDVGIHGKCVAAAAGGLKYGIWAEANDGIIGLYCDGGGSGGNGLYVDDGGASAAAAVIESVGGGVALDIDGGTDGVTINGSGTSSGLTITSGGGTGADAVVITTAGAAGIGLDINSTSGQGVTINSGGASGLSITAGSGNNDAITLTPAGSGLGINGTLTTVNTLTGHTAQTGDSFARLGAPAGASVSADIAAIKAETALIVADTNELQTDWVDGGRLDLILDATATASVLATVDTNVDAILVDTGTTIPGTITTMQADVTAILADTAEIGTAGAGLTDLGGMSTGMKAEVNVEVDGAFTTQMADSVATDGTIPTREQAVYQIVQFLTDFSISGTTLTANKVDGTTPLMTFTLDSATTPTSITRAT